MDYLALCDEAILAAERFPSRHSEYKGSILVDLAAFREKILRGKIGPQDERAFVEIILLTEKWVEG